MNVTFDFNHAKGLTTITANPESYDSPVLSPVEIFAAPFLLNYDRLHVAAALLFHLEISGEIVLDETMTCSRHVAIQIRRYFAPVDVTVRNQSFTASAIPTGSYVTPLHVTIDGQPQPFTCNPMPGEMLLRFAPEGVGAMFSESEVVIGSNLLQGHSSLDASLEEVTRMIGGGVLFAEELHISGFRLPGRWHTEVSLARLEQIEALLSTVGLTLEWGIPS